MIMTTPIIFNDIQTEYDRCVYVQYFLFAWLSWRWNKDVEKYEKCGMKICSNLNQSLTVSSNINKFISGSSSLNKKGYDNCLAFYYHLVAQQDSTVHYTMITVHYSYCTAFSINQDLTTYNHLPLYVSTRKTIVDSHHISCFCCPPTITCKPVQCHTYSVLNVDH